MARVNKNVMQQLQERYGESYVRELLAYRDDPGLSLRDLASKYGLTHQAVSYHLRRLFGPRFRPNHVAKVKAKAQRWRKHEYIPTLFKIYPELLDPEVQKRLGFGKVAGPGEFRDKDGKLCLVRRPSLQRIRRGGKEYVYRRMRYDGARLDSLNPDYIVVIDGNVLYKVPVEKTAFGKRRYEVLDPSKWRDYRLLSVPNTTKPNKW